MPRATLWLLIAACLFSAAPAAADELIQRNGFGWAVAASGAFTAGNGYAYAGCAGRLQVFEVVSGTEVTHIDIPGKIEDAELVGNTLYLAAANAGLLVYDVSTPSNPVKVRQWKPDELTKVRSVAVSGGYAYCRLGATMATIRLSDLVQTGSFDPSGTDHAVYGGLEATSNAVVYQCFNPSSPTDIWVGILDRRTSPGNPTYAGKFDNDGRAAHLYATDASELVAVACTATWNGIQIINVSNPSAPSSVGTASGVSYGGSNVFVDAGYAYMTTSGSTTAGELAIFDVSGGAPVFLGKYSGPMGLASLGVTSNRAVCSGANNQPNDEIKCVNVTNKASPTGSWSMNCPAHIEGVYVQGDYMYLAAGHDGLWIADVSDPDNVAAVSTLDPMVNMNLAENIWVSDDGNYTYTAEGNYTVFYNTSNKLSPSVITTKDYGGWQEGIHRRGNYVYVCSHGNPVDTNRGGGLTVVDVSDPLNPTEAAWYAIPVADGQPKDCWVDSNGYIYIAASRYFTILRFTPPSTLQFVWHVLMPGDGEAWDAHKEGDCVFLAIKVSGTSTSFRGLRVYDVSDPANPTLAATFETPQGFEGVWVEDGICYLTTFLSEDDKSGLTALDVSDPNNPVLIDSILLGDTILNAHVRGKRIYLAGYRCGAPILELVPTISAMRIRNLAGDVLAEVDDAGNLTLRGSLSENSSPAPAAGSQVLVKNKGGATVASIDAAGNLVLSGSAHPGQSSLSPPIGSLVVKNGLGEKVLFISPGGHLYLLGQVITGP